MVSSVCSLQRVKVRVFVVCSACSLGYLRLWHVEIEFGVVRNVFALYREENVAGENGRRI